MGKRSEYYGNIFYGILNESLKITFITNEVIEKKKLKITLSGKYESKGRLEGKELGKNGIKLDEILTKHQK